MQCIGNTLENIEKLIIFLAKYKLYTRGVKNSNRQILMKSSERQLKLHLSRKNLNYQCFNSQFLFAN